MTTDAKHQKEAYPAFSPKLRPKLSSTSLIKFREVGKRQK
jgi:hypothetical protein